MPFQNTLSFAQALDNQDELKSFRSQFIFPKNKYGDDIIYFCGNSLGLQPKTAKAAVEQELDDWAHMAVVGHFNAKNPWTKYDELLSNKMAQVVGALPSEVVVMNTLTVNLHLMMVSFYQPTATRNKILIDWNPFPSDRYAFDSQIKFHGYAPSDIIIEPQPLANEAIISEQQIIDIIETHGHEIALVIIGGVNYYSGQVYNMELITQLAHAKGCKVGFDLAHAAGNIPLALHHMGCDFAVWCTYKYMNSGPGAIAAAFIHERHHKDLTLNRFEGWWGTKKETRFKMAPQFDAIEGAEAWQLSNPPILAMAPINASLDIFIEAGMERLRKKSEQLTAYLEFLLADAQLDSIKVITPEGKERGCQLSLRVKDGTKNLFNYLVEHDVIGDWREPDVIRVAPTPLYNSFQDVWSFVQIVAKFK
jgi:kynureninase